METFQILFHLKTHQVIHRNNLETFQISFYKNKKKKNEIQRYHNYYAQNPFGAKHALLPATVNNLGFDDMQIHTRKASIEAVNEGDELSGSAFRLFPK